MYRTDPFQSQFLYHFFEKQDPLIEGIRQGDTKRRNGDLQRNSGESGTCSHVQYLGFFLIQIPHPADQKTVQKMPRQYFFPLRDRSQIHDFILLCQHLVIADKLFNLIF